MASDEDLVGRLADGDEQALRELLRRYERPLSHFIYRHTSGRDVEDLYQETWLRVVQHAARFDRSRRFSTWLFHIAVNRCRDWHRRRPPEPIELPQGSGSDDLPAAETRLDAQRLLAMLPEPQREVVLLRYYQDLTEDEVAQILDCPKGTVKSRLHNALARLAATVRGQEH
ncbi:MAG TPA: RNA polymerase sigma factor [Candidatus Margulisiibacteriota bacterium]|nr:RNA polymerase sigma factor [Candidatus Margulisiibacteriota bacterium]